MNLELLEEQDLSQGSLITATTIDEIVGFTLQMKPKEHGFAVMKIQSIIEEKLTREWGDRRCKTCIQNGGVRIMTETEIVAYYKKHWASVVRSCEKAFSTLSDRHIPDLGPSEVETIEALRARYSHLNIEAEKAQKTYPIKSVSDTPVKLQAVSFKGRKRYA